MDPLFWQIPLLISAGIIAGILNVLAGGGSLLTLPILIFLGLPSSVANGTNRIAIFFQNIFAIRGFRQHGIFPLKTALICTAPALIGSYIGASFAVTIDDALFNKVLALIMVGVMVLTALDPARDYAAEEVKTTPLRLTILLVTFFGVGLYGGFVQAGVGFLVISGLLVHGLDLVRINAIKVIVIFAFTVIALGVFIAHGEIDYGLGIALAVGNSIGGIIGTRLAVRKGHTWIKRIVTITVLVFALKLFFF
jgi:uncharacterized membrane protein YfcA